MKKYLFCCCLFLFFNQCKIDHVNENKLSIVIEKIEKYKSVNIEDEENNLFSIDISLINNSDSTIDFWIMNCSWSKNFIFDNEKIQLDIQNCDRNFPKVTHLKIDEKLSYHDIFRINKNIQINNNKLGFVLIRKSEIQDIGDFDKLLSEKINDKKDIIWSEPIKIVQ